MKYYINRRAAVLLVLILVALGVFTADAFDTTTTGGELLGELTGSGRCPVTELCVAFLDVGQGDSILIQSPSGIQMLIDGGRGNAVLRALPYVIGIFDHELEYVLATHPDADHVGGLVDVFERYKVDTFIRTENESDTEVWQAVQSAGEHEGAVVEYARRGQRYDLGDGVVAEILFPDTDPTDMESNTSSIVLRLTYGSTSFLFTGDSPKAIEEYLVLIDGEHLKSDVLKVGHHGSRTSSAEDFIDEVRPTYAVISVGADNQYGHPHVEVTDMLFNKRINTLRTDEEGTIIFTSDGQHVAPQ